MDNKKIILGTILLVIIIGVLIYLVVCESNYICVHLPYFLIPITSQDNGANVSTHSGTISHSTPSSLDTSMISIYDENVMGT
jgi:hypothetical protein